jgi:predicted transcriptional regulator
LKKIDIKKLSLIKDIIGKTPKDIKKLLSAFELVGINERVTYHKIQKGEKMPYTHIFENATILCMHRKLPILLIYGPHIKYIRNFIEG